MCRTKCKLAANEVPEVETSGIKATMKIWPTSRSILSSGYLANIIRARGLLIMLLFWGSTKAKNLERGESGDPNTSPFYCVLASYFTPEVSPLEHVQAKWKMVTLWTKFIVFVLLGKKCLLVLGGDVLQYHYLVLQNTKMVFKNCNTSCISKYLAVSPGTHNVSFSLSRSLYGQ